MQRVNSALCTQCRVIAMETKIISLWLPVTVLLFLRWTESAVGMVTLSPMSVAPVCRVGDPLQLTCTASVDFIRWRVFQINEQGMNEKVVNDEIINSMDTHQMSQSRVNSATLTITRASAQGDLPMVSTLSIDSVDIGLNGTVVNCTDVVTSTNASTTIHIIDVSQNIHYTPMLNISNPHYGAENVTVTVEWTQLTGVTYTVKVSPSVPTVNPIETTRYQLTIPYNKTYNFSVVAATPCRPNATNFIILNYAICRRPSLIPVCTCSADSIPRLVGFDDNITPVEGSTVRFSCPPGLELIGPDSATCRENGEWGPDIKGIMCNHSAKETIPEPRLVHTKCTDSALAAAVSSTVIIFLVISILMFIGGFMSGLCVERKFLSKGNTTERPHPVPFYDDVQIFRAESDIANQEEQNLQLKKNVAYRLPKPVPVDVN